MIKKVMSIILSILLLSFPLLQNSLADSNNYTDLVIQNAENIDLNYEISPYEIDNEELNSIEKTLDYSGYTQKVKSDKFSIIENNSLKPALVKSKEGDNGILIPISYENDNYYMYTQIAYSKDFKAILSLHSTIINKNTLHSEDYFSYSDAKYLKELRYSLPKFVCDMGGALACTTYCGGIGLAFPVAGFTCSMICGSAFGYICDKA
ncbi:MAG: putative immunity/bacteriocin fusion bifunctional protein [Anaerococcus sp.]|nr:putative immunity/bacteriocin fusion bifunctional protein [Anaerococcus sp.]